MSENARPADSDRKSEWEAAAIEVGIDVEGMTKEQIIEAYDAATAAEADVDVEPEEEPEPEVPTRLSRSRRLVSGSKGPEVVALQRRLGLAETGKFGPEEAASVKREQRAHNIFPSGIVDAVTMEALGL